MTWCEYVIVAIFIHIKCIKERCERLLALLIALTSSYLLTHKPFTTDVNIIMIGGDDDAEDDNAGAGSDWDSPKGIKGTAGGRAMGPSICLLTTKACGQGITLTGRLILILILPLLFILIPSY